MLQLLLIPVLDFGMFRRWMQKMSLNFMKLSYCCCWNDNCQIDFGKWHKWHKKKKENKEQNLTLFLQYPKILNLYPNSKIGYPYFKNLGVHIHSQIQHSVQTRSDDFILINWSVTKSSWKTVMQCREMTAGNIFTTEFFAHSQRRTLLFGMISELFLRTHLQRRLDHDRFS